MTGLVRKLRSLLYHARHPAGFSLAVRRNLALARAAMTGRGWFAYRSALGVDFVCFGSNPTSVQLYVKGYQEAAEIALARAWLCPGDACVDVGANVGLLSVVFASAVGSHGGVLAIEPSPEAFARLTDTLGNLSITNIFPVACCASNVCGVTSFYVAEAGADAEEESMKIDADREDQFRRTLVPCAPLSTLCEQHPRFRTPSLIKIDVEGAEPLVLAGAEPLLEHDPPPLFIAEIHREALANYGYRPSDVLEFFPSERFELYFLPRSVSDVTEDRKHGLIYSLRDEDELPIYSNMIAVPVDGSAPRRTAFHQAAESFAGGELGRPCSLDATARS